MTSTAKEWDEVRSAFATSILVDTGLNSLAQNLDGPEWPIPGQDETPGTYIDLDFEEALTRLRQKGQAPAQMDRLIGILRETLAFDSPFGEMVEQARGATERDNPILKNLARLQIPENFPIALTTLDAGTLEFCKLEELTTLGEFAVRAQQMAQAVIVGGDFRRLLNALSHVDEAALADVLPFRPGQPGLHLVEAVAQATRAPDPAARTDLAINWFRDEHAALERDLAAGGSLERHLVILGNPELEQRVAELLRPQVRGAKPVATKTAKKRGWWARLFGR